LTVSVTVLDVAGSMLPPVTGSRPRSRRAHFSVRSGPSSAHAPGGLHTRDR
jgi:hypothetical protein